MPDKKFIEIKVTGVDIYIIKIYKFYYIILKYYMYNIKITTPTPVKAIPVNPAIQYDNKTVNPIKMKIKK